MISNNMRLENYESETPLEEFKIDIKEFAPRTQKLYLRRLHDFCNWGETTPNDFYDWEHKNQRDPKRRNDLKHAWSDYRKHLINDRGLHPNTANNFKKPINKFLSVNGLNPLRNGRGEGVDYKGAQHINKDNIKKLLKWAENDTRIRALVMVAKDTGLRVSDLEKLTVDYYKGMRRFEDKHGRQYRYWSDPTTTEKKKVKAKVVMGPEAVDAVKDYIGNRETGALFLKVKTAEEHTVKHHGVEVIHRASKAGEPMTSVAMTSALKHLAKPYRAQGVKISAHSLRKFFLNRWTSVNMSYGKLMAGKKLPANDEAYTLADEEIVKKYAQYYDELLAIYPFDQQAKEVKNELEKVKAELERERKSSGHHSRAIEELEKDVEELSTFIRRKFRDDFIKGIIPDNHEIPAYFQARDDELSKDVVGRKFTIPNIFGEPQPGTMQKPLDEDTARLVDGLREKFESGEIDGHELGLMLIRLFEESKTKEA